MEKLVFKATINAPRQKVWEVLWGKDTYPAWTAAFAEGSAVETNWEEGSRVLFHDGSNNGMVSSIARKIPGEYMSFKHLGEIKNGVEDLTSDAVKAWAGSMENYTLKDDNGKTSLLVEMESDETFKEFFEKTWPVALDKLKALSEK
ncbi:SRPBCC family protein [Chitinophaga sp. 22321]|uniref:SRPBCC domain-containing protein n=1 Tax=Chitinophaga hostae TaxID=2831022 RepID=A0ABS5J1B8_9BACT|nr:SRPBCC domain-containing protein [Chitinophaga hostae]MBS0029017.1 SRPBCC domain-containing protein [Chitinophaga hostae]